MSKKIGIIGGGFAGTMTAVQLISNASFPLQIFIITEEGTLNRGIAYNPYSERHILNVVAGKMSAFPDLADDFVDWVMTKDRFKTIDKSLVANSFLPRKLYGDYLADIWQKTLSEAAKKNIQIIELVGIVHKLHPLGDTISLTLNDERTLSLELCILATGNQVPKNPYIKNTAFYSSSKYYQNPWKKDSVENIAKDMPILIIGNGLSMVDTIIGLREQKFDGEIYSISPNGFNILPHRHTGMKYTAHLDEIFEGIPLKELVQIVNKHVKIVRNFGVSAEPIIDALRPLSQKIWKNLTEKEKTIFMSRLRHLFGVARHRIPLHIYDKIQKLRIEGKLHIQSGKLVDILERNDVIEVTYFDKKESKLKTILVSRVINCTGPETDFSKLEHSFLSQCIADGILIQDDLKLGLKTNIATYNLYSRENQEQPNLFTLGSNLKGELWESTAINELRQQAESLAKIILNKLYDNSQNIS